MTWTQSREIPGTQVHTLIANKIQIFVFDQKYNHNFILKRTRKTTAFFKCVIDIFEQLCCTELHQILNAYVRIHNPFVSCFINRQSVSTTLGRTTPLLMLLVKFCFSCTRINEFTLTIKNKHFQCLFQTMPFMWDCSNIIT